MEQWIRTEAVKLTQEVSLCDLFTNSRSHLAHQLQFEEYVGLCSGNRKKEKSEITIKIAEVEVGRRVKNKMG